MEEYKIVEGFPNYEVSNLGNVRNRYTKQILKPKIDRGHARVCLKYIGYKIQGTISEAIRKGKTNKPIHGYTFRLASSKEIDSLGESELYHIV